LCSEKLRPVYHNAFASGAPPRTPLRKLKTLLRLLGREEKRKRKWRERKENGGYASGEEGDSPKK